MHGKQEACVHDGAGDGGVGQGDGQGKQEACVHDGAESGPVFAGD